MLVFRFRMAGRQHVRAHRIDADERQARPDASEAHRVCHREGLAVHEHADDEGDGGADVLNEPEQNERYRVRCRCEQDQRHGRDRAASDEQGRCRPSCGVPGISEKGATAGRGSKNNGEDHREGHHDRALDRDRLNRRVAALLLDGTVQSEADRQDDRDPRYLTVSCDEERKAADAERHRYPLQRRHALLEDDEAEHDGYEGIEVVADRRLDDAVHIHGEDIRTPIHRDEHSGGNEVAQCAPVLQKPDEIPSSDEADEGGEDEAPDHALRDDLKRVDVVQQLPIQGEQAPHDIAAECRGDASSGSRSQCFGVYLHEAIISYMLDAARFYGTAAHHVPRVRPACYVRFAATLGCACAAQVWRRMPMVGRCRGRWYNAALSSRYVFNVNRSMANGYPRTA